MSATYVDRLAGQPLDPSLLRTQRRAFWVALVLHLVAAVCTSGVYHPDEHYQILEFAQYKRGENPAENLPWEFHYQMRPTLQPTMALGFMEACHAVGLTDPGTILLLMRVLISMAALVTLFALTLVGFRWVQDGGARRFMLWASALLWFLPFQHARFSSENLSAILFIWGLIGLVLLADAPKKRWVPVLGVGLLMGLAFVVRFHAAFMIGGVGLYLLLWRPTDRWQILPLAVGVILAFGFGILIDAWFYGNWVISSWNYLEQNLILGKSKNFGTEPPWWYFKYIHYNGQGVTGQLIWLGTIVFWLLRPKHIVSIVSLLFVAAHVAVAHKEGRFLWPLASFLPIILAGAYESASESSKAWLKAVSRFFRHKAVVALYIVASIPPLLMSSTAPANRNFALQSWFASHLQGQPIVLYSDQPSGLQDVIPLQFGETSPQATFYGNSNWTTYPSSLLLMPGYKPAKQGYYLAIKNFEADTNLRHHADRHCELVFQSIPDWICKNLDFNKWLKRTQFWYIYHCNCADS